MLRSVLAKQEVLRLRVGDVVVEIKNANDKRGEQQARAFLSVSAPPCVSVEVLDRDLRPKFDRARSEKDQER